MRLHDDLIKQGILHSNKVVRSQAVLHFSQSYTQDESVLPLAIQAVEQYGWDNAFTVAACMIGLLLNDAALPWLLSQYQQHKGDITPDDFGRLPCQYTLNSLLANAHAELLARHKQAILDVENLEDRVRKIVAERIDLLTADTDFCWRELEKVCVESKDIKELREERLDHAYALSEAIAREKDRYAEKVLDILSEKIEDVESNPKVWMDIFAVGMAGEMGLDAAIPLIIAKLKEGGEGERAELLTEQCEAALVRIGGDAAIHAAADMYRQGDGRLRMAACAVLQHMHCDLAVSTALEFLANEENSTIRAFLGAGLASHFALEAIEPLRLLVLDGPRDDSYANLKRDMVVAAMLMDVEFPEREQWEAEVEAMRLVMENLWLKQRLEQVGQSQAREIRRLESEYRRLKQEKHQLERNAARQERKNQRLVRKRDEDDGRDEEQPPTRRIGRNDPCSCGSGKKFKKCCLGKQGLLPLD